ncbi:metal ABC transporter solute-binding protein, Zn/Mn family [Pasteuria penetrans]|uniref:metal ABC transporter solute-binding protein, Zn/Mn family n=1 Tax=Pasteuria penetrans TaxID=86005 RepID=UPI000FA0DD1F|nr:zinc ABC transporter substrate-binding protein [Pasteuria penetrans]
MINRRYIFWVGGCSLFLVALFLWILNTIQNSETTTIGPHRLKVTTTTNIMENLIKEIGGEDVEIRSLMGHGIDPHTYKATPGDLGKLRNADLIVASGLKLEGRTDEVIRKMSKKGKKVVQVGDHLPKDQLIQADGGSFDPHFWNNVNLYRKTVPIVAKALCEGTPGKCTDFQKRANLYDQKLIQLETEIRESLSSIPEERRVLITSHDAFSYMKAYGIEISSLQGINTSLEAGMNDIQRVIQTIVNRNIRSIFIETSAPKKGIEAIVEGAKQYKGITVRQGGTLFADSLDHPQRPAGTYLGMMRANVKTIVEGLK